MQVKVTPVGVLDKDTDIKYVGNGNYTDAENIRHRDSETENTNGEISLIQGNDLRVTIPNITAQDKQYRIYISSNGIYTGTANGQTDVLVKDYISEFKGTITVNLNQRLSDIASDVLDELDTLTSTSFTNLTAGDIVITKQALSEDPQGIRNISTIDTTTNTVSIVTNFNSNPSVQTGDAVKYTSTGTTIGGLSNNSIYYLRGVNAIEWYLYNSREDALADTNKINITGSFPSVPTHTLSRVNDLEGYFDVENSSLDESYYIATKEVDDAKSLFGVELIQDHIYQSEQLNIIGSITIDDDTFVVSVTDLTPYGNYSVSNVELQVTVGEIGHVAYDRDKNTHTYTRLLRSKDFGFNKDYRVQVTGDKRSNAVSLYLTDNNTTPKVVYLNKPFVQDGAMKVNGGEYELTNLEKEIQLFLNNSQASIELISVNSGGRIKAGNKRYSGYFLSTSNTPTEYLYPTNPVCIYPTDITNNNEIQGGDIGELCDKTVRLQVKNIPQGVFDYFVLVAIEYEGEAFSVNEIKKYSLSPTASKLDVEHNGFADLNQAILLEDVVRLYSKYIKVQNMSIFSNKLILSNLTEDINTQNLSGWASEITHSLEEKLIDSVGLMGTRFNQSEPDYKYGEYQDPYNVHSFTGYMMNDTYRFGVQVKWKESGAWSAPYWVDDIRFDELNYNIIDDPYFSRRTANNIDVALTQGENGLSTDDDLTVSTKVYYVKFGNINLNYVLPNGKTLKESIDGLKFVRAERIPEVIATGAFLRGNLEATSVVYPGYWVDEYSDLGGYHDTTFLPYVDGDKVTFFISPDIYYGHTEYNYISGDKIKFLGSYHNDSTDDGLDTLNRTISGPSGNINTLYTDFTGYFTGGIGGGTYEDWQPVDGKTILGSGEYVLGGSVKVSKQNLVGESFRDCTHAFLFDTELRNAVGNHTVENGLYYGQIFRDRGAHLKYPTDKAQTLYYGTGHFVEIDQYSGDVIEESVFGGDVFTQKTHFKVMIPNAYDVGNNGSGFGIYSQNVVNTQLPTIQEHTLTEFGPGYKFPQYLDNTQELTYTASALDTGGWGNGLVYWIRTWSNVYNQYYYNFGYNVGTDQVSNIGYDENDDYDGKKPSTIIWSETKLIGGKTDSFRIFMPLSFMDLDLANGDISGQEVVNNAFYTWQDRSFMRHYFNEGTLVTPASGSDIVLGAAEFAGPPGAQLSSIGCDKKWSVVKGNSQNGGEAVYWYNNRLRKFVRFAQDGVRVLSDNSISSFLDTEIKFLKNEFNPSTNYGIHGVWNDRFAEAVFTFKGIDPSIEQYVSGSFVTGDLVINDNATRHHTGVHTIFRATSNFTVSSDEQEPGVGESWEDYWEELTPESNPEYYTLITLVYDELKNGFITKWTVWPNIYVPVENTFYSVSGSQRNKLYLHDTGSYSTFYGTAYDGSLTSVMNYEPNISKNYDALQLNSLIKPYRLDFYTKNHTSFNTQSEFEQREDLFYGNVRNDSTGTGIATNDTSRLWGTYMKTKFTFQKGIKQKLFNYIVKFRPMSRLYNT